MSSQIEAKDLKQGSYVIIDDEPCEVKKLKKSAPGKHGHAKLKIQAEGIFDNKTRVINKPGDAMMMSPDVQRKSGQIVSESGNIAQIMDLGDYETFEVNVPEDVDIEESEEVTYWDVDGKKTLKM